MSGPKCETDEEPMSETFDFAAIQDRWLPVWDELDPFRTGRPTADGSPRERRYMLDMFPYPSGDLHMGHAEAYAFGDVLARYWQQLGYDVMHPIGWDSFGLPAENAAIARNQHPADWTYKNIETQAASFRRYAISFDWSRRLHTSDPEYYRWTQWLFLRFFERGLAYRKASAVNWCPNDQTVLANEQVINGHCERCGTLVTKKTLTQWYFKITEYADRLLDDMRELEGSWPERVLTMQRNWIGRSVGAHVDFAIEGRAEPVTVFTTRPDTLYGATFFVVAADSALAADLCAPEQRAAFDAYVEQVRRLSDIDRMSTERVKTGVFLGRYAINPVNDERIPVWAADYVLADYGTGAIMAVPAHDQRDLDFALTFGLPVRIVVATDEPDPAESGVATPGDGVHVNSGPLDGLDKVASIDRIISQLEANGVGKGAINYRLRDWLLSRQRFWGAPIPIVHCSCRRRSSSAGRRVAGAIARPARCRSATERRIAAGGRDRVGEHDVPEVRRPGNARHRHDGHLRRLIVVLPAVLLAASRRRRVRSRRRQDVDAGRPVRRRRRARDPASAVQQVLHQGAA